MITITDFNPAPTQNAERFYSFRSRYKRANETENCIRAFFTAFKMPEPEAGIRKFLSESVKKPKSMQEISKEILGIPPLDLLNRYRCDTKIQKAVERDLSSLQTKIEHTLAPGIRFSQDRLLKIKDSKTSIIALELRLNEPINRSEKKRIHQRLAIEIGLYKELTRRSNFIKDYKKSFNRELFKTLRKTFASIAEPFTDTGFIAIPEVKKESILFRDRISIERDLIDARKANSRILTALLERELTQ